VNQGTKIICAAVAVLLGATVVGGIALAQHQTGSAPALAPLDQTLPATGTPSAIAPLLPPPPPVEATPPATGQQANTLDRPAREQRRNDFLNILAQNLKVSRSALNGALQSSFDQELDKAVAANQITAQQAARIKQRIDKGNLPLGVQLGGQKPGQPSQGGS